MMNSVANLETYISPRLSGRKGSGTSVPVEHLFGGSYVHSVESIFKKFQIIGFEGAP